MRDQGTRGIVHVAAASEDRGRVVLQLRTGSPNRIAMVAAARIARAFGASIEGVFVEDQQLIDMAAHGFIREITRWGSEPRTLSPLAMARDLAAEARSAHERIIAAAAAAEVPLRLRVMRDEPVRAMAVACAECGPWNVIVVSEPFGAKEGPKIAELLDAISASTGVVIVGPKATTHSGRILVAVEDIDRLSQMVRAAERMLLDEADRMTVVLFGSDTRDVDELESQARLALAGMADVLFATAVVPEHGYAAAADILHRHGPGLVIAQIGGRVVPVEGDLAPLASVLPCPVFVVR